MMKGWPSKLDNNEKTRRLLDLFVVSVLLDAGAGTKWQYKSKENGKIYRRSEGLAVASLEMFRTGIFSSNPEQPEQVDGMFFFLFFLIHVLWKDNLLLLGFAYTTTFFFFFFFLHRCCIEGFNC